MNKILLIIQREFLTRVRKKTFLIATILVPLIFPAIMGGMIYLRFESEENKSQQTIRLLDESDKLFFENTKEYAYMKVDGPLDSAKARFGRSNDFALLYVPSFEIGDPRGFKFFSKTTPGITLISDFENKVEGQIRDIKLTKSGLTEEQLDRLKTDVYFESFNITDTGDEKKSDSNSTFWLGYVMGFLIYIFLFAYGAQVMQGVIEEKSSKIVEVIVSTVRPFHMMVGKVIGVASVGVFQFLIWVILMTAISTAGLTIVGQSMLEKSTSASAFADSEEFKQAQTEQMAAIMEVFQEIPIVKILLLFLFYFLGGYLMYGALFAAVGSAVDSPSDAQQFMMPIMMPIIVALMGLFLFVFEDPNGSVSFWLSVIPFTSPIVMIGRIGFGVPGWEIALSMVMLIIGFLFTMWLAGRIYRIGILMHGTKVNYKVLGKWLMMKN